MVSSTGTSIQNYFDWANKELTKKEYGEVSLKFKVCNGRWYRDWETDRKSTRLNSSHRSLSRMPSSA